MTLPKKLLIDRRNSLLLIVDIQTRLAPSIFGIDRVIQTNKALIEAANELDVPVIFTEQYPQGLGHTNTELLDMADNATVMEKSHFNASREPEFDKLIQSHNISEIIVTGTEAHICVLQTALGILNQDIAVSLVEDATGSRRSRDKEIAIARMQQCGCRVVTAEMVLFEWLERANTDVFRNLLPTIRNLVKRVDQTYAGGGTDKRQL